MAHVPLILWRSSGLWNEAEKWPEVMQTSQQLHDSTTSSLKSAITSWGPWLWHTRRVSVVSVAAHPRNSLMHPFWNIQRVSNMFLLSHNMCSDGKDSWYGRSNWSSPPHTRTPEQTPGNLLRDSSPSPFQPIDGIRLQCGNDGPQGGEILQDSTFLCGEWWRHKRHLNIRITVSCWFPVLGVLQLLWILTSK